MKKVSLSAILLWVVFMTYAQNLIGYSGGEIQKYMKKNYQEMNFEKVTNASFKYLKYSDNTDSQTILFFLNRDSVCSSEKIICDAGKKNEKVKEYNANCQKNGSNQWIDKRDGKEYLIRLFDEKWLYNIVIEPVNQ